MSNFHQDPWRPGAAVQPPATVVPPEETPPPAPEAEPAETPQAPAETPERPVTPTPADPAVQDELERALAEMRGEA